MDRGRPVAGRPSARSEEGFFVQRVKYVAVTASTVASPAAGKRPSSYSMRRVTRCRLSSVSGQMSPRIPIRLLAAQSDQRLAALVRDGHERAFEALVQRYRRPLLR